MPVAFAARARSWPRCGAVVFGFFCVRLSSIYFAMLTLAFAQIVYAIVHQWYEVTGGDNGAAGRVAGAVAGHAAALLLPRARRVRGRPRRARA